MMIAGISGMALSAQLQNDLADLLALLPAVRRCAEIGGEISCVDDAVRAAYRNLRTAHNVAAYTQLCVKPPLARPFCASAVAYAFMQGAAALCPRVDIQCRFCAAPLWVAGDVRLFCIALGNALLNSLLYAGDAPRAVLQLGKQGEHAVFTLRDNGKGILPDALSGVFVPGMSADPYGDGEPAPGLGLGLAIVQQYAAAYSGRILAQSTVGKGSSLALSLPLCAPCSESMQVPQMVADSFSPLYVQLCPLCDLPL
ncbi:MAG: ATP-binding protein [Ruthenibacterium sp.]